MPARVKVSGSWATVTKPSVKVGGAWKHTVKGWVKVSGTWSVWFTDLITDAFTRTTTTDLGTADTGETWSNVRGTWYATGTQAKSDGTASNYPLASVPLGSQDTTTSVSTSNGVGPAFWITDSNNWWAAHPHSTSSTSSTCTGPTVSCTDTTNTCSPGGCGTVSSSTSTVTTYYSTGGSGIPCDAGDTQVSSSFCGGLVNCCQTTSTQYTRTQNTTQTTTTYAHYLRIIKMVSGTVSTATGDVSLASAAAAVKVVTSGDAITATAYSDTAMTTSLGVNSYTPTSPTKGTATGIVKAPSSYNQGSTADSFSSAVG